MHLDSSSVLGDGASTPTSMWRTATRYDTPRSAHQHDPLGTGVWPPLIVAEEGSTEASVTACLPPGTPASNVRAVLFMPVQTASNKGDTSPRSEYVPGATTASGAREAIPAPSLQAIPHPLGGGILQGVTVAVPTTVLTGASTNPGKVCQYQVIADIVEHDFTGALIVSQHVMVVGELSVVPVALVKRISITPRVCMLKMPTQTRLGDRKGCSLPFPSHITASAATIPPQYSPSPSTGSSTRSGISGLDSGPGEPSAAEEAVGVDAEVAALLTLLRRFQLSRPSWLLGATQSEASAAELERARKDSQLLILLTPPAANSGNSSAPNAQPGAGDVECTVRGDFGVSVKPLDSPGTYLVSLCVGHVKVGLVDPLMCMNSSVSKATVLPAVMVVDDKAIKSPAAAGTPVRSVVTVTVDPDTQATLDSLDTPLFLQVTHRHAEVARMVLSQETSAASGDDEAKEDRSCVWRGVLVLKNTTSRVLSLAVSLDKGQQWIGLLGHITVLNRPQLQRLHPSVVLGPPGGATRVKIPCEETSEVVLASPAVTVQFVAAADAGSDAQSSPVVASSSVSSTRVAHRLSMDGSVIAPFSMTRTSQGLSHSLSAYGGPPASDSLSLVAAPDDGASVSSMTALVSPSSKVGTIDVRSPELQPGAYNIQVGLATHSKTADRVEWFVLDTTFYVYDTAVTHGATIVPSLESRYGGSTVSLTLDKPLPLHLATGSLSVRVVLPTEETFDVQASFSSIAKRKQLERVYDDRYTRLKAEAAAVGLGMFAACFA